MRLLIRVPLATLAALALLPSPALSCSTIAFDTVYSSGPNLRVVFTDRGQPVPSLPLRLHRAVDPLTPQISRDGARDLDIRTDNHGIARFRKVPPGLYILSVHHRVRGSSASIQVGSSPRSELTISMRWPDPSPTVTSIARGVIRLPGGRPDWPQPSLAITLLDVVTGRPLSHTTSDQQGQFSSPPAPAGLYLLQASFTPETRWGEFLIELRPDATEPPLALEIGYGPCGGYAMYGFSCRQSALHMSSLAGRLVDPTGAPIPRAGIYLVDKENHEMHRLVSDDSGRFGSLPPPPGNYQLTIIALGFSPLRLTLAISPDATHTSFEARLGFGGSCNLTMQ